MRAIFFDEESADAVVARLLRDGFEAAKERERLAGEDDDEDHPWAVVSDAPAFLLEMVVDDHDGWLDEEEAPAAPPLNLPPLNLPPLDRRAQGGAPTPVELPDGPRRIKRPDLLGDAAGE